MKTSIWTTVFVATMLACSAALAAEPDTLLTFKNGSEVRGKFIGMDEGQYSLELPDGRTILYPADDVEKMSPIEASTTPTPTDTTAAPTVEAVSPETGTTPLAELCRDTTLFTEFALATDLYEPIKEIEVSQKGMGYHSGTRYYPDLAQEARELGGDAVISVREWRAVSGWSWSAPHVGGLAVRWSDKARTEPGIIEYKCF